MTEPNETLISITDLHKVFVTEEIEPIELRHVCIGEDQVGRRDLDLFEGLSGLFPEPFLEGGRGAARAQWTEEKRDPLERDA